MKSKFGERDNFDKNCAAALALAVLLTLPLRMWGSQRQTLQGHIPTAVTRLGLRPLSRLAATNQLHLAIGLALHHTNTMDRLFQELYKPASPRFRRYLTLEQFTESFGPTKDEYQAVSRFAAKYGLQVSATYPNRVVLDVVGRAADIERAFQVRLNLYQHPTEARRFYAPDTEPSVDAGLAVVDIGGLDDYALPHPAVQTFTHDYYSTEPGTGSGPNGNFMGKDFRNAYVPGVKLDGTGQIVGLVSFWTFYAEDVAAYEQMAGLPNVPVEVDLLDGFNGVPTSSNVSAEAPLDIDMVISMAPGLSKVVVFDAGPNYGLMGSILSAMVNRPEIKQFSSSSFGSASSTTLDNLFKEMALQGQSFFIVSGDGDSWVNNPEYASMATSGPVDDPYVTSVGATTLSMNGAGDSYASETVWNWAFIPSGSGYIGSGGGTSVRYPIPGWQEGVATPANGGSSRARNFPDVSMVGDNIVIAWQGSPSLGYGGTSISAPLWAGFTALVNQEAAANGQPPVGLLNPALYAIGQSTNYTNCFHDVTSGNNATDTSGGLYPAVPGYDLCTGWGSPNGSNLIQALALPQSLVISSDSTFLFTGPAGGSFSPTNLVFTLSNRIGSVTWAVGVDSAWLTCSPVTGRLTAGGPTTNVVAALNNQAVGLSAGEYSTHLFFTNLADGSVQARPITLEAVAIPVINAQPADETVLEGMTASFSVGVATNALLSYQWLVDYGGGATHLVDGSGIRGATTGTLTLSNVSSSQAGTYSIMVSNAAGSVLSAGASLTVLTGQAPVILSQPAAQTVLPGANPSFRISAAGDQPLSYIWLLNGSNPAAQGNVYGANGTTLSISNAIAANTGSYSVVITNSFGSVTSTVAALNLPSVTVPGVILERLYSFTNNGLGCVPYGGLVQASDGNFYGTTPAGGFQDYGTVYRLSTNGAVSLVVTLTSSGSAPFGALIQGTNGSLYGTGSAGGNTGDGAAFRATTSGGITDISLSYASTGSSPVSRLAEGQDGNFYGTALTGGKYGFGTVFKLTAGGLIALSSFNNEDGATPKGPLVPAPNGNLYGTATQGGTNGGWGTIFAITPSGTLSSLFSFGLTNGATAIGGLTFDGQGNFYGTTYDGGANGDGTIFEMTSGGTFRSLYSFTGASDGSNCYGGLLLARDGNFYGTTENGGVYGVGTVFRLSPGGTLTTLAQFDGYQGANPEGTLVQGNDGSLYGTTSGGGSAGLGAIYRLSLDGALQITAQPRSQTVFAGDTVLLSVATAGALPTSYQWVRNGTNLVDGGNVSGSSSRVLSLSNASPADATSYSVIVSNSYGAIASTQAELQVVSSGSTIVSQPVSQTVLAGAAVTLSVEANGAAPLFFQWQKDGANLVDGGNILGSTTPSLTLNSGSVGDSGIYSVLVSNTLTAVTSSNAALTVLPVTSPSANLVSLYSFAGLNTSPASSMNPYGPLVQGADGNLYGTTLHGGEELLGSAFRVSSSGVFTLLYSFTNGLDGANPEGGLIPLGAGSFYGASPGAGPDRYGTLFKLTSGGQLTPLYAFGDAVDGGSPLASLMVASDGQLYGTAAIGGTNGAGTIFSLNTNGVFSSLWSFNSNEGSYPAGPLVQATNGQFYATTSAGGSNGLGSVFTFDTNGTFTTLVALSDAQGTYPSNGLIQASDGAFYGTASHGGTNGGWGTVFRMTAGGDLATLYSFNWLDGAYPTGGLLQGTDGKLYGTTSQGGVGGQGTVFQITTNGALKTLVWFYGPNGANPQSSLIQAKNGCFYGTAQYGGTGFDGASQSGNGLVFRLILPMFVNQSLTQAVATVGQPYAGSIAGLAVAPPGDILTFSKAAGPAWLSVTPTGGLSGTPAPADLGTEHFTVTLSDTNGWSSTANLQITVAYPLIVSLSYQGANLILNWTGGQPPYGVQVTTNLDNPAWQSIAGPMTNAMLLLLPPSAPAFYRVEELQP